MLPFQGQDAVWFRIQKVKYFYSSGMPVSLFYPFPLQQILDSFKFKRSAESHNKFTICPNEHAVSPNLPLSQDKKGLRLFTEHQLSHIKFVSAAVFRLDKSKIFHPIWGKFSRPQ